jgi:hypothetical protein
MAGISAQMVLVDTRNNGQKHIILPEVEFNHCIVKADLDNKKYYIELTDSYLPFGSLPNDLIGATILEIPNSSNNSEKAELHFLKADNRTKDVIKRIIDITTAGSDLNISVKTIKQGNPSSAVRSVYMSLDYDKQLKELEGATAKGYKNHIRLNDAKFNDLDKLNDSVEYTYSYRVKDEIAEIGSLRTFRVTYPDVIASLDNFSADTRIYPVNYWAYEDIDIYETVINIKAPAGAKFVELPASENFSFKGMQFSIQYILKAADKLSVIRKFSNPRNNIAAEDYPAFKSFFERIVKAEQRFIAFK